MDVNLDFISAPKDIPDEEKEAASIVYGNLRQLGEFQRKFAAALSLFDHIEIRHDEYYAVKKRADALFLRAMEHVGTPEAQGAFAEYEQIEAAWREEFGRMSGWINIPARDAGMTIFHFAKTIEGLRQMPHCPTLRERCDAPSIRIAAKLFNGWFPHFRYVRHSIAHSGELWSTLHWYRKNIIIGPMQSHGFSTKGPTKIQMMDNIHGRTVTNTYLGRLVSFDLSQQSLNHLTEVKSRLVNAFPHG